MKTCIASEFATEADLKAYRKAKAMGLSDIEAFKVGDNCIGCWGDDTSAGSGPQVALTPEDMVAIYGSKASAKHETVLVTYKGKNVVCRVGDIMPAKKFRTTAAELDCNPDACVALGLPKGAMVEVTWDRVEKPIETAPATV